METSQVEVQGVLQADGTLVLDERPNLPAGRVTVLSGPWVAAQARPLVGFGGDLGGCKALGLQPRTAEAIDAEINVMRDEWTGISRRWSGFRKRPVERGQNRLADLFGLLHCHFFNRAPGRLRAAANCASPHWSPPASKSLSATLPDWNAAPIHLRPATPSRCVISTSSLHERRIASSHFPLRFAIVPRTYGAASVSNGRRPSPCSRRRIGLFDLPDQ